jgi:hypothetical protein
LIGYLGWDLGFRIIKTDFEKTLPCLVLKKFCKINPLRVEERVSPDSLRESFPYLACAEN